jgi:hypothetical protein
MNLKKTQKGQMNGSLLEFDAIVCEIMKGLPLVSCVALLRVLPRKTAFKMIPWLRTETLTRIKVVETECKNIQLDLNDGIFVGILLFRIVLGFDLNLKQIRNSILQRGVNITHYFINQAPGMYFGFPFKIRIDPTGRLIIYKFEDLLKVCLFPERICLDLQTIVGNLCVKDEFIGVTVNYFNNIDDTMLLLRILLPTARFQIEPLPTVENIRAMIPGEIPFDQTMFFEVSYRTVMQPPPHDIQWTYPPSATAPSYCQPDKTICQPCFNYLKEAHSRLVFHFKQEIAQKLSKTLTAIHLTDNNDDNKDMLS